MRLKLRLLKNSYNIYKLNPNQAVPELLFKSPHFFSVTKTDEELSVVCESSIIIHNFTDCQKDFKALKVEGILDFSLSGILYRLAKPLKKAQISIFAISTYNTDYLLVRSDAINKAISVLKTNFDFIDDNLNI